MRIIGLSTLFWCFALGVPAATETLPAAYADEATNGRQKAWHATLDLRNLPQETRPASIAAQVDTRLGDAVREKPQITIAINGIVVARRWASRAGPTRIETKIDDRLLSTRNHVTVAITSLARRCDEEAACSVTGAELRGPLRFGLAPATAEPLTFAQHVTRFRKGVAVTVIEPRDRRLGELAAQAMAPHAPRRAAGPAEIVVSRELPQGVAAPLRFDTGPVTIKDREGRVLYDQRRLDSYTIAQLAHRGEVPVLWVRPGTQPLAATPLDLDYGNVALFGSRGREIAFSADQDHALTIAYATDAQREAQTGLYWRLTVLTLWLALTAGLVIVLRRMEPLERPRTA